MENVINDWILSQILTRFFLFFMRAIYSHRSLFDFVDTDTDFSESEAFSSLRTAPAGGPMSHKGVVNTMNSTATTTAAAVSQSEPEDVSGNSYSMRGD